LNKPVDCYVLLGVGGAWWFDGLLGSAGSLKFLNWEGLNLKTKIFTTHGPRSTTLMCGEDHAPAMPFAGVHEEILFTGLLS
jgi:hypothetical protein